MSYKINLGGWNSIFAVPSEVVDKHIRLASESQLKVLLYMLRHSDKSIDDESLSSALKISAEEVENALMFWIERGLFVKDSGELTPSGKKTAEPDPTAEPQPAKKPARTAMSRAQRPDHAYASKLIEEDPCLSGLFDHMQTVLKKPISPGDSDTVVMLYTTFGLPCDVIAMMITYLDSIGSADMRAIERMGIRWSDSGIKTAEDAEKEIERLVSSKEAWGRVSSLLGIKNVGHPTKSQTEHADRWLNTWRFSDEMIQEAYERCVNTKGEYNIRYINAILQKWHEKGIKSMDALNAYEASQTSKKKKYPDKKGTMFSLEGASFDISRYENDTLFDD